MVGFIIAIVTIAAIVLLHVAFKSVGDKTRFARFTQGVLGVVALVIGTFGLSLIF